jgi:hypothetical protein
MSRRDCVNGREAQAARALKGDLQLFVAQDAGEINKRASGGSARDAVHCDPVSAIETLRTVKHERPRCIASASLRSGHADVQRGLCNTVQTQESGRSQVRDAGCIAEPQACGDCPLARRGRCTDDSKDGRVDLCPLTLRDSIVDLAVCHLCRACLSTCDYAVLTRCNL